MDLKNPSKAEFKAIFQDFADALVEAVIRDHYERTERKFRRCHPRDVIRVTIDLIKFEKQPYALTKEMIDKAFELKFVAPNYEDE